MFSVVALVLHPCVRIAVGAVTLVALLSRRVSLHKSRHRSVTPRIGRALLTAPCSLGRGHILFETGFTWEHEGNDLASVRTVTWPQVELHGSITLVGAGSRRDLGRSRLGNTTRVSVPDRRLDDTTTGLDDLRLGVKVRLVQHHQGCRQHADRVCEGTVGSAVFSRRYAEPFTRFAWWLPLTKRFGVAGTVDLKAVKEDDDHARAKPAGSAALGASLTDTLDSFVGIVTEPPDFSSRPKVWSVEAGLVRAVGEKHQLDLSISFAGSSAISITGSSAPDSFAGSAKTASAGRQKAMWSSFFSNPSTAIIARRGLL